MKKLFSSLTFCWSIPCLTTLSKYLVSMIAGHHSMSSNWILAQLDVSWVTGSEKTIFAIGSNDCIVVVNLSRMNVDWIIGIACGKGLDVTRARWLGGSLLFDGLFSVLFSCISYQYCVVIYCRTAAAELVLFSLMLCSIWCVHTARYSTALSAVEVLNT